MSISKLQAVINPANVSGLEINRQRFTYQHLSKLLKDSEIAKRFGENTARVVQQFIDSGGRVLLIHADAVPEAEINVVALHDHHYARLISVTWPDGNGQIS